MKLEKYIEKLTNTMRKDSTKKKSRSLIKKNGRKKDTKDIWNK